MALRVPRSPALCPDAPSPRKGGHSSAATSEPTRGRQAGPPRREGRSISRKVTTTAAALNRCTPKSRVLDREFLTAPFIHALGQLNSLEPSCAQHPRYGRRPVRSLADRDNEC